MLPRLPSLSRIESSIRTSVVPNVSFSDVKDAVFAGLPQATLALGGKIASTLVRAFDLRDKNNNDTPEVKAIRVTQVVREVVEQEVDRRSKPVRVGYLGEGETFMRDGKEFVIPEGYLYNIKAGRLVRETTSGTMPFASFSVAGLAIGEDAFANYAKNVYRRLDKFIETLSAIPSILPVPAVGAGSAVASVVKTIEGEAGGPVSVPRGGWLDDLLGMLGKALLGLAALWKLWKLFKKRLGRIFGRGKAYDRLARRRLNTARQKAAERRATRSSAATRAGAAARSVAGRRPNMAVRVLRALASSRLLKFGGPAIVALATALDANTALQELEDRRVDMTADEYRRAVTEVIVNSIATTTGGIAGGILGGIIGGPAGALVVSAAGAQLVSQFGRPIAKFIADAVVDNDIDKYIADIANYISTAVPNLIGSIADKVSHVADQLREHLGDAWSKVSSKFKMSDERRQRTMDAGVSGEFSGFEQPVNTPPPAPPPSPPRVVAPPPEPIVSPEESFGQRFTPPPPAVTPPPAIPTPTSEAGGSSNIVVVNGVQRQVINRTVRVQDPVYHSNANPYNPAFNVGGF